MAHHDGCLAYVFGDSSKSGVIYFLLHEKKAEKGFTADELAGELNRSSEKVNLYASKLAQFGLLKMYPKFPNQIVYKINKDSEIYKILQKLDLIGSTLTDHGE